MRRASGALLALAVLAGCGSEPEKRAAATATPAATRAAQTIPLAEFIERADAICRRTRESVRPKLRRAERRLASDGKLSVADVMRLNTIGYERNKGTDEKLKTIPRPDAKAGLVRDYIDAVRDSLLSLGDAIRSFEQRDASASQTALRQNRRLAIESARIAAKVGFEECGTEFSTNAG